MLKNKLKNLIENRVNDQTNKFEIIHESVGAKIVGGDCMELSGCTSYFGNCPVLISCGHFMYQQND